MTRICEAKFTDPKLNIFKIPPMQKRQKGTLVAEKAQKMFKCFMLSSSKQMKVRFVRFEHKSMYIMNILKDSGPELKAIYK